MTKGVIGTHNRRPLWLHLDKIVRQQGSNFIPCSIKARMLHEVPFSHIWIKCAETLNEGWDARRWGWGRWERTSVRDRARIPKATKQIAFVQQSQKSNRDSMSMAKKWLWNYSQSHKNYSKNKNRAQNETRTHTSLNRYYPLKVARLPIPPPLRHILNIS